MDRIQTWGCRSIESFHRSCQDLFHNNCSHYIIPYLYLTCEKSSLVCMFCLLEHPYMHRNHHLYLVLSEARLLITLSRRIWINACIFFKWTSTVIDICVTFVTNQIISKPVQNSVNNSTLRLRGTFASPVPRWCHMTMYICLWYIPQSARATVFCSAHLARDVG